MEGGRKKASVWKTEGKRKRKEGKKLHERAQAGILSRVMVALLSDSLLMSVTIQTPSYLYTPVAESQVMTCTQPGPLCKGRPASQKGPKGPRRTPKFAVADLFVSAEFVPS